MSVVKMTEEHTAEYLRLVNAQRDAEQKFLDAKADRDFFATKVASIYAGGRPVHAISPVTGEIIIAQPEVKNVCA